MHRTSSKTQDVSCQGLCVPERASSTQRKRCEGGEQDFGKGDPGRHRDISRIAIY